ncbi:MAG: LamG domain-containing protein, partial [Nitrosopumilaceae archaeon]
ISIPEEILNVTSDEQTIPDVTQPPSDNLTESETINSIPELNITLQLDEQDYLVIENTNSTRDLSSLTLSTWVKPDYSLGSPELTIISKEKTFVLSINNLPSTKTARFSVYDGIKWNTVESSTQINEEWTHLAASFNGSLISIYVNSELESTLVMTRISTLTINGQLTTTTVDTLSSDSDIVVGSYLNTRNGHVQPINQFSGLIDSVQLYDSLLNPLEITGLYSQNLHAFEETAVSVEPVTILTKPTIDTNLQEYIPQSQPSLIERGIDFERYYIGNGQYELRLGKPVWVQTENGFVPWDIKETGNSFKIKNGRIGFEIDKQTGNSKYSDPATQQTIVPNETWIVQKFIDNTWTSIGIEQQSPSIGVTSNQTGVFVTVTKTMQTGQLVILYEIKEGQPLKSTATFTNYGNTDQFRVLQSWQGIDSDEIQDDAGKQKMDKDKSSRISDKKESKFKFMKNGKGLLEHDQSKASDSFAGYDIHSKNKQIDWIFENPATFTLDTGESLVIDPTTAALTAATAAVVGACTNCSTASAAATDDTKYMGGTGNPATRMTAVEGTKLSAILDDTKIPAGATIDKVQVDLLGAVIATGSVTFDAILFTDPTTPTTIGSTITSSSISSVTPTFTTFSFGSSSLADWGSPALTESNVDTTTFGVRILVNTLVTANGAQIDLVTMTITYTPLTVTDTVTASDSLTATLTIARS